MTEKISHDEARALLHKVQGEAWGLGEPLRKLEQYVEQQREEQRRLRERGDDLETFLESERRQHDETRGYRQHAEQQVAELKRRLCL